MKFAHQFIASAALACLSASSFAATVFTSSASFLANVQPGAYTENFTGLSAMPPASFSGGVFGYSISAPGDTFSNGDFISTSLPNEVLTVSFSSGAVTALGANFYAVNLSDAFQAVSLTLTLSDGTVETFTPSSVADSYRGFISTVAITSLTIGGPGTSLYAGLDNLTVGRAVPEPTGLSLAGLALAGLFVARRRKG